MKKIGEKVSGYFVLYKEKKSYSSIKGITFFPKYPVLKHGVMGFTLVELMVTVSILAIGIVLVLRSFISNVSILEHLRKRIYAIQFLETKMHDCELKVMEEKGVIPGDSKEEIDFNNRKAVFTSKIFPLEIEGFTEYINEVNMNLSWQESNIDKDEKLVAYSWNKNEE